MRIIRSLPAIIAAILIAAIPLQSPAQFTVGVGVAIGVPPPALPYYAQPAAPYPNWQWQPGYWAWGQAGYYWVPGVWVAPPTVGLYWTPGYWGYGGGYGGGYGWTGGYWGASVGFYGGVNYGFGYYGSGFVGGVWSGGAFRYNTAVVNVNRTVIHNTYINKTVINKNVCNNCNHVSYNGGKGGVQSRPTPAQIEARKTGRPPTTDQIQQARVAAQDRNLYANVNKGKPPVTALQKPVTDPKALPNYKPVTATDKQQAQNQVKTTGNQTNKAPTQNKPANTMQSKPASATHNKPPSNTMHQQSSMHQQGSMHQGSQGKPPSGQGKPPSGQGKPPSGGGQGKPPSNGGSDKNNKPPRY